MNITILRGANLNQWEMQNYTPLAKLHSIKAVVAGSGRFNSTNIGIPVDHSLSPIDLAQKVPGGVLALKFIIGDPVYYFGLEKHLAGCDIIHTAETYTAYTAQALKYKKKSPKTKVVATVWENIPFAHERFAPEKKNKEQAIGMVDLFLAMSQKAKQALIAEGVNPAKILVQMPGIDINRFSPQEKDLTILHQHNISSDSKIILTIARNVWEKGIDDLILAVKLLLPENPNVHLIVIGNGPQHTSLQKLAKKLNIHDRVLFLKKVSYAQMSKYHNLADLFVLSSKPTPKWQEQFGMVLIESMACQKCVISTTSGSIPEVIGAAGVLIPSANHFKLKDAIVGLLRDDKQRIQIASQARQRALDKFDCRKVAKAINDIYESITS